MSYIRTRAFQKREVPGHLGLDHVEISYRLSNEKRAPNATTAPQADQDRPIIRSSTRDMSLKSLSQPPYMNWGSKSLTFAPRSFAPHPTRQPPWTQLTDGLSSRPGMHKIIATLWRTTTRQMCVHQAAGGRSSTENASE